MYVLVVMSLLYKFCVVASLNVSSFVISYYNARSVPDLTRMNRSEHAYERSEMYQKYLQMPPKFNPGSVK
jgi:hypothetical protein